MLAGLMYSAHLLEKRPRYSPMCGLMYYVGHPPTVREWSSGTQFCTAVTHATATVHGGPF
jgi:hypothetical protein